ncbi:Cd(II)/Pb(II)-responsive transcriptional regulator [Craterilacuibacter sp.]|uniref:Cd(II)/Pb(II)-responsive transcriptional regulator n=1 Tax=Craterilacuibacter sp. TaxID=2870909 RepID=UPI003F35CC4B
MKIGELAQIARCTVETVRYYEKEGLLAAPERSAGNYRHYSAVHVERLRFIRNCRALGMTHEEIRALLALLDTPSARCGEVNALLDEHIGHVDARLRELGELKVQLAHLRLQCNSEQAVSACGILQGLAKMETEAPAERHTHFS